MKCNIGWVERTVRVLLALPLIAATLYVRHFSMVWAYVCLGMGSLLLLTAVVRWCPVSMMMGRSTADPLPESGGASS